MNAIETINYRGHEIEIYYDEFAGNPFKEWDCEPPIVVSSDRGISEYGIDLSLPELTKNEIKSNIPKVIELLVGKTITLLSLLSTFEDRELAIYRGWTATDYVNNAIEFIFDDIYSASDKMEFLVDLYAIKGIVAITGCATGYCQSHYADVMAVATQEWIKKVGAPIESIERQLKGAIKLYGQWAFGDVYGYSIPTIDESCWGFYGSDYEKSGLMEEAKNAIDYHIELEHKKKIKQVKTWIANRVPLHIRAYN